MANRKRRVIVGVLVLFVSLILTGCGNSIAEFQQAVRSGDIEKAEAMLVEEPTLVEAGEGSQALLFEALQSKQTNMVLLLIDNGVDVNVKDKDCFTPLHCAAQQGHTEIVELLIAKEANVDATDMMGETPLHAAVLSGHKEVVVALLAGGANVDAENRLRRTPLHFAARDGYIDVVEVLLAQGASINAKDKSPGRTPLHYAAQQNHKDVAEFLLAQGADVNARDLLSRTPLYWASVRAQKDGIYKDVVELLRKSGGQY